MLFSKKVRREPLALRAEQSDESSDVMTASLEQARQANRKTCHNQILYQELQASQDLVRLLCRQLYFVMVGRAQEVKRQRDRDAASQRILHVLKESSCDSAKEGNPRKDLKYKAW